MFKLSIVIISKENPAGLKNTVESIPTSKNIEIIVVSGNKNSIEKEVRLYSNHPTLTVLEGPDSGIYCGMNRGILAAKGRFIWFLNSGDTSLLKKESDLEKLMQKTRNKKWLIALQKPNSKFPITSMILSKWFLFNGIKPIPHQSTILDRETLLKVGGYNEKYKIEADQELFLKLYLLKLKPSFWIKNISRHQLGGIGDLQKKGTFQHQIADLKKNLNLTTNKNRKLVKISHKLQKCLWTKL